MSKQSHVIERVRAGRVGRGLVSMAALALSAGLAGQAAAQDLVIGAAPGSPPTAAAPAGTDPIVLGVDANSVIFNHSSESYVFAPSVSGPGDILHLAGDTIMTGDSPMSGILIVQGGTLSIEGEFGDGLTTIAQVQNTAPGSLTIRNGGAFLGRLLASSGSVAEPGLLTVTGPGSRAEMAELYVATDAGGRMIIADGAVVRADEAWFGYLYGSQGEVTITGENTLLDVGILHAGLMGSARVIVSDGAALTTDYLDLYSGWDTESRMTITGEDSLLDVDNAAMIAASGNAVLEVLDGATARAGGLGVAGFDQYGVVRVAGEGSTLSVIQDVGLGLNDGGRATLEVSDGAVVTAASLGVGYGTGARGDVTVSGSGSRVEVGEAAVGMDGHGRLTLTDGGTLSITNPANDSLWLGLYSDASGLLVIGSDPDSPDAPALAGWLDAPRVQMAYGAGIVFNHASDDYRFSADILGYGDIGHLAGDTILDGDSEMIGLIAVTGGELTIEGMLLNRNVDVGEAGGVIVGIDAGDIGSLVVRGDGRLTTGDLLLGDYAEAHGTLRVEGEDASVESDFAMFGYEGFANVELRDGASLTTDFLVAAGAQTGMAAILAAGEGTRIESGLTLIGSDGLASLQVLDGADMEAVMLALGGSYGARGMAEVSGLGSRIEVSDTAAVGMEGEGLLRLSDGGVLSVGYEGSGVLGVAAFDGSRGEVVFGSLEAETTLVAAGRLQADSIEFGDGEGVVTFRHDGDITLWTPIWGSGTLRADAGTTRLAGGNLGFTGQTIVGGGRWDATLVVDGDLGGSVSVADDGVLSGTGVIAGDVTVGAGGTLAGGQGQTLTLGSLVLDSGAFTDIILGAGDDQALFDVAGDLTLDGVLNISGEDFEVGVQRLFDYGGALTDNEMEIGETPELIYGAIQTSVGGQVNLVTGRGPMWFWDGGDAGLYDNGAVDGGAGVWRAGGRAFTTTDGRVNGDADPVPAFIVFQADPGVVTLDASGGVLTASGLQFAADGYRLEGDALTIGADDMTIRVGDGTAAGADHVAVIASTITGAGGLVKSDLGTLILTGANTYAGGTTVRAGTLQGDARSFAGDLVNDATTIFDQAMDGVFGGDVSGAGLTVKTGAGRLTLGGLVATDWSVREGELFAQAARFAGDVDIQSDGRFILNVDADRTWDGRLSGDGTFQRLGAGWLALSGDSSLFDGSTLVEGGGLFVSGALGGEIHVGTGGAVAGTGRLGDLVVDGGVLAPGASIGTLTVDNLTLRGDAVYEVEVDPAGSAADLIAASGAVTIEGGLVRHVGYVGDYGPASRYTIITAGGGVTGRFDGVESDFAFLDALLGYDAGAVYLTLERNDIAFPDVAETSNQAAVGTAVEAQGRGAALYDAVVGLSEGEARFAFDALSGDLHGSIRTGIIQAAGQTRDLLRRQAETGGGVWASVQGGVQSLAASGQAASLDSRGAALWLGGQTRLSDAVSIGGAIGRERTTMDQAARGGEAEREGWRAAAYAHGRWDTLDLSGGAVVARDAVETVRRVAFPGVSEQLEAAYDVETRQAFAELGWTMRVERLAVRPFVGVTGLELDGDAFVETGGEAALSGEAAAQALGFADLGIGFVHAAVTGDRALALDARVGWRRAWGDLDARTIQRFGAGPSFAVAGAPVAENSVVASVLADIDLSPTLRAGVAWTGEVAREAVAQSLTARLSWRF